MTTREWTVGGAGEIGGVVIGSSTPPGAAVSEAGVVLVADPRSGSVIVIDRGGKERGRIGRRGSGPGDLQQPGRVGFADDSTVWVEDRTLRRITYFSIDGTWLSDRPAPREAVDGTTWIARPSWSVGTRYALAEPAPGEVSERQTRVPVVVWDESGAMKVLDWLNVALPGRTQVVTSRGFPMAATSPIRAEPLFGVAGNSWVFAVDRSPPESSERSQVTIRRFDPDGHELPAIAVPYEPIRMSEGKRREAEAGVAAFLERAAGNIGEFDRQALASQTWIPTFYPPIRDLFADASGVWLRRYSEEERMPAERYSLEGRRLGIVPAADRDRWLDANRNYILTMTWDQFDVPLLHLHTVALPPVP